MSVDLIERNFYREILKMLIVFKEKGLLTNPLYGLSKDLFLSKNEKLVNIFKSYYPLPLKADIKELNLFQKLFYEMEYIILQHAKVLINELYEKSYNIEDVHLIASKNGDHSNDLNKDQIKSLIYGEVEFDSFSEVLIQATNGLHRKKKFVDIGSGTCKALCIAGLISNFDELVGIEIIPGLHNISIDIVKKFQKDIYVNRINSPNFDLICGSFLDNSLYDWTDADLIFANSTCFSDDLIEKIEVISRNLKIGARLITFTSSLSSKYFKVIFKKRLIMSWGPATVFIHERISDFDHLSEGITIRSNNFNANDQLSNKNLSKSKYFLNIDENKDDNYDTESTTPSLSDLNPNLIYDDTAEGWEDTLEDIDGDTYTTADQSSAAGRITISTIDLVSINPLPGSSDSEDGSTTSSISYPSAIASRTSNQEYNNNINNERESKYNNHNLFYADSKNKSILSNNDTKFGSNNNIEKERNIKESFELEKDHSDDNDDNNDEENSFFALETDDSNNGDLSLCQERKYQFDSDEEKDSFNSFQMFMKRSQNKFENRNQRDKYDTKHELYCKDEKLYNDNNYDDSGNDGCNDDDDDDDEEEDDDESYEIVSSKS